MTLTRTRTPTPTATTTTTTTYHDYDEDEYYYHKLSLSVYPFDAHYSYCYSHDNFPSLSRALTPQSPTAAKRRGSGAAALRSSATCGATWVYGFRILGVYGLRI